MSKPIHPVTGPSDQRQKKSKNRKTKNQCTLRNGYVMRCVRVDTQVAQLRVGGRAKLVLETVEYKML